MTGLNDIDAIENLDTGNARSSLSHLPDQCKQAWDDVSAITFPDFYKDIYSIVCAGMGGSAYGSRIAKSLYDGAKMTSVPLENANSYWLPGYVGEKTLVILSSYSGNTEETLSCAVESFEKKAKVTGITSGGTLGDFLKKHSYPAYIFDAKYNPSKQPRIGVGYMVMGLLAILEKLGKIPLGKNEVSDIVSFLRSRGENLKSTVNTPDNPAKQLATKLRGIIPVFVIADFLKGAAHAIRNPLHETAKQFGLYFTIPELNHHLMEGLQFPKENRSLLRFIFVSSDLYDLRNQERMKLTYDVVKKNSIQTEHLTLQGKTALMQTFELIQLGGWVTFYLAMLNDVNPNTVPWVDYFKQQLKNTS